jgi:hypothetical protein
LWLNLLFSGDSQMFPGLLSLSLALSGLIVPPFTSGPWPDTSIEAKLHKPVTATYDHYPLQKVLNEIRETHGLNCVVDEPALADAGVAQDTPVTISATNISLRSFLNMFLKDVELAYQIKDDVVLVTTQERARGEPITMTFPVADIVLPLDFPSTELTWTSKGASVDQPANANSTATQDLIALITKTIEHPSWSKAGGPGTIEYCAESKSLVVKQTADLQEQIQDLLAALRKLQTLRVSVEVRLLSISSGFYEQQPLDVANRPQVLDSKGFNNLLAAAKEQEKTAIRYAPPLILFQAQPLLVHPGHDTPPVRMTLSVSADRKSVCVQNEVYKRADYFGAWTVSAGGTIVLCGSMKKQSEVQGNHVLICVTPHVVVVEDVEDQQ